MTWEGEGVGSRPCLDPRYIYFSFSSLTLLTFIIYKDYMPPQGYHRTTTITALLIMTMTRQTGPPPPQHRCYTIAANY